ncbi:GNAT family N-acetyltransferase [Nocardioides litoris]|uniref:GNAT family N-acetyltransferase n=1 Tax=Nocardioides litoris TaxID=1926648 RepID=UPI001B87CF39|nr:GNAT family N-acetyltransferase [Nocardioides litoris]
MAEVRIVEGGLDDPAVVALLEGHVAQLRALSPPESTHALDLAALRQPAVRFWTAYDGAEPVGCAALTRLDDPAHPAHPAGHAELKSMRTAPHRTGEGIAARLLEHVLAQARAAGVARVSLETGSEEFFAPARRLYARRGFEVCGPFGSYRPDPLSTFMTRSTSSST